MEEKALAYLKPGVEGRVKEILGCGQARKRLYELGLHKGAKISVVKNDIGPIIINLSGHKLALGRGLAHNVIIKII